MEALLQLFSPPLSSDSSLPVLASQDIRRPQVVNSTFLFYHSKMINFILSCSLKAFWIRVHKVNKPIGHLAGLVSKACGSLILGVVSLSSTLGVES